VTPGSNGSSVNDPNSPSAIGGHLALNSGVRVRSNNHSIVIENALPDTKYMIADLNGRVLKSSRIHSTSQEIRLNNRGPMLVIVGNRTYKIMK
jgi:oligosaccharide reducing-end xylanase